MIYQKIAINKINGIKEYHDLDAGTIDNTVAWLDKYMTKRGWDLSNLEGKEIYVNKFVNDNCYRSMDIKVTESKYGFFKVNVKTSYGSEKSWIFDPNTNLRTEWGNEVHEDWIADHVEKELEDKIKRLEKLSK